VTGPWTAFGIRRAEFFGILLVSIAAFVWLDGQHLRRLVVSYAVIPPALAAAQLRNRTFGWGRLFGATVTLAVIKLVVTAVLLAVFRMAG
jgi:hypothetical protein